MEAERGDAPRDARPDGRRRGDHRRRATVRAGHAPPEGPRVERRMRRPGCLTHPARLWERLRRRELAPRDCLVPACLYRQHLDLVLRVSASMNSAGTVTDVAGAGKCDAELPAVSQPLDDDLLADNHYIRITEPSPSGSNGPVTGHRFDDNAGAPGLTATPSGLAGKFVCQRRRALQRSCRPSLRSRIRSRPPGTDRGAPPAVALRRGLSALDEEAR